MICGSTLSHIIYCEVLHGLFAILWCLPLLVVSLWILTTRCTTISNGVSRADTLWMNLRLLGISLLVVGLSFLSAVYADIYKLGF